MVYGATLEMLCTSKGYREFESLRFRFMYYGIKKLKVIDASSMLENSLFTREQMLEAFSNGSIFGKIAETLVANTYQTLCKPKLAQTYFDLEDKETGNFKVEVRTLTKGGCLLIPSNQIGAGRSYNEEEYLKKISMINGFVIVDIRTFPEIFLYWLDKNIVYDIFHTGIKTKKDYAIVLNEGSSLNENQKERVGQILHETGSSFPTHIFD